MNVKYLALPYTLKRNVPLYYVHRRRHGDYQRHKGQDDVCNQRYHLDKGKGEDPMCTLPNDTDRRMSKSKQKLLIMKATEK